MNNSTVLDASRGTVVWGANWVRQDALSRLLDDLLVQEKTGYSQETCDKVSKAIGKMANAAAGLPDHSWWRSSIVGELEGFLKIYEDWNNHEGEEQEKVEGRKKELKKLRAKRNKLATRMKKNLHIIQNDLDLAIIDSMYEALSDIVKSSPEIFTSLAKALNRYIARK